MEKSTFTPLGVLLRERVAEIRSEAGLTQRDLADRLGREQSFVARIEIGERRVDVVEFFWICRACGVDPGQLATELMGEFAELEKGKRS